MNSPRIESSLSGEADGVTANASDDHRTADLATFSAMIASAAHLPLIATHNWTTRAAAALCADLPGRAALVLLVDAGASTLIHAGAAMAGDHAGTAGLLLTQATRLCATIDAGPRSDVIAWANTREHPFHDAGLAMGTVVRSIVPVHHAASLVAFVFERGASDTGGLSTTVAAATEFLARSAKSFLGTDREPVWLSQRETEVLEHVVMGRTVNEIAEALERSPHTVHDHLKAIHRKSGAATRGQLIAAATGRRAISAP